MISAENVSFRYPDGSEALRPVDLALPPGRLITVVGPNGSGKSTLLRVLARVLRPATGRVLIGGVPADELSSTEWSRKVGYLPQTIDVSFPMLAEDVVRSGLAAWLPRFGLEGTAETERARSALEMVDARALGGRLVGEMSGGERKRVFLARVLVGRPAVLLLDEPLASLDLAHVAGLGSLLRSLAREEGATIVLVAHDFLWASAFSDEVIVMSQGRVVGSGHPCDVLTSDLVEQVFGIPVVEARDRDGGVWILPRVHGQ